MSNRENLPGGQRGGTPNTNPIVLPTGQAAVFTANPFYDSRFSPEPREDKHTRSYIKLVSLLFHLLGSSWKRTSVSSLTPHQPRREGTCFSGKVRRFCRHQDVSTVSGSFRDQVRLLRERCCDHKAGAISTFQLKLISQWCNKVCASPIITRCSLGVLGVLNSDGKCHLECWGNSRRWYSFEWLK